MDPSWVSPIILPETNSSPPENRHLEKAIPIGKHYFQGRAVSFTPRTINILHLKMMGTVVFLTPDLVFLTPPCFFDPWLPCFFDPWPPCFFDPWQPCFIDPWPCFLDPWPYRCRHRVLFFWPLTLFFWPLNLVFLTPHLAFLTPSAPEAPDQ